MEVLEQSRTPRVVPEVFTVNRKIQLAAFLQGSCLVYRLDRLQKRVFSHSYHEKILKKLLSAFSVPRRRTELTVLRIQVTEVTHRSATTILLEANPAEPRGLFQTFDPDSAAHKML